MNNKQRLWLIREQIKQSTKNLNYTPNEAIHQALLKEIQKLKIELADIMLAVDDETICVISNMIN